MNTEIITIAIAYFSCFTLGCILDQRLDQDYNRLSQAVLMGWQKHQDIRILAAH